MLGHHQMQRLASYASELKEMASDLDSSNPEATLLVQSANESNRLIKLRKSDGNENYLKQIQEHFPQDDLRLTDREVQCSGGNRWRSSVTKSLIGGGLKKASMLGSSSSVGSLPSPNARCTASDPQLILDSAAKLVVGIHSRERHLFLFSDFLVVAKGRFDTNFRLKNKIMTSNIWVTSYSEKALVIGWPLHNSTFVFECSYHRDLWLVNLKETIKTEKAKEVPQSTQIKIIKKDYEYTAIKSLLVANNEMASQVVQRCLDEFHILDATAADFQLCVASTEDETTFSLSGHEYPFTIWMNSSQASAEGTSDVRIQFILRSNKKVAHRHIIGGESNKSVRKGRGLKRLFKRPSTKQGHLKLFERELSELCEQNAAIPFPIMQILRKLYVDGPRSDGVFRKSANHAKLISVKQSLDCGEPVNFAEIPVPMAAVLLKEFLRNLPNCLLNCQMYQEWMRTALIPSHEEQISSIKQLVQMLPPCNQLLLQYLVCVLCNLAKHSEECKMNSSNLAICIGQSLLWPGNATVVQKEDAQNANVLVRQMIESAEDIFGPDCLTLLTNAAVMKRPTQMALRGVSADSDSRQSSGATEDSVCNSLDFEFTRSCSEADYSPIVPDKAGFKLQNSQSCDSGLQLGDEGQECRGRLSASKMPRSAKVQYYTSSESREEDDCKQAMPRKLRHCKKKPAPGIPILQQSSSVDTLSSIQSGESLHLHLIESPHDESIDASLVSFSDVLPRESFLDPPVAPSKRALFFRSMLPPPANPLNVSLDQLADTFPPAPKTVKSQKKLSTNDSGVSFLVGSLNNNSEEISDAEHGRDAGNVFQKNRPPTVEVGSEQEHCSAVSVPSTFVQWNLSGVGSRQFDQARFRPPPLSDLHGTTFAEECLETPEELKEDEFEYAKRNNAASSSADSAFTNEWFSLDSGDPVLGESCLGSYLNQKSPCLLSSDSSWPDAPTNTTVEEKESRQQDSLPRRPLIRADAVESDPEKLQQGMTAAWSSQLNDHLDQPGVSGYSQPVMYSSASVNPVGEKLSAMSSESSTPCAVNSSYEEMAVQNSSVDDANLCDPMYKEMTLEKAKVLLHHHKPSEQHLISSVRKFSEKNSVRGRQLIPHCKSLDNVSLRTDSKNSLHLEQSKSPSHGSLVPNKLQTQEMREPILTESELSKCRYIRHVASLKDISQHKARRQPIMDNRMENTSTHALTSKQFSEIRSFYDQCHEKGCGSLQSAEVVNEDLSSSRHNIRPRLTKKRSKNRYLRKRNSDPRLNVEGKGGSDLGRSKSDSSERYRNSKRVLQANSRRSEIECSKENFNSLENDLLQKNIKRSGKSVSAKDLSASVRSAIHHSENVKRKSVTIKDRDWHKELARQYIQSAHSSANLTPSRKSDVSSTAHRFGREVEKNLNREADGNHGCTGRSYRDSSLHLSKASSAGEIFLNDKLTGDVFDDSFKDLSQHTSKPSQISLIGSSLTSSVVKPHHSAAKEVPRRRSLKLSNTRVRELRENFLGQPLNSDASKVSDSCSRTYISSPSAHDSAMIGKSSRRPLYESVGRIIDDAKLLDPANISWSVAQLKELFSTQHNDSTNTRARMSHSKSEDWSPSTKVSALPRLG